MPKKSFVNKLLRNQNAVALTHFIVCCESLGITDAQKSLDKMLTLDYIISNEDRHYNNFGAVRNAETLEWFEMAPIYDSGTSLWHTTPMVGSLTDCRPFKKNHAEQIKLVKDLSWFDYEMLNGVGDEIIEILAKSKKIDEYRSKALAEAVLARAAKIQTIASKQSGN